MKRTPIFISSLAIILSLQAAPTHAKAPKISTSCMEEGKIRDYRTLFLIH